MKTKKSTIKSKPNLTISKELDKFANTILFPEKVAKANETLKKVGLPKFKFVK